MKELKLIVFKMMPSNLFPVGMLSNYISLTYNTKFDEVGDFKLEIPYSEEELNILSRQDGSEKLVLLEDGVLGICHKVNPKNTNNKKTIVIQGQLAEGLLDNYTIGAIERIPSATSSPQNLLNLFDSLEYIFNQETIYPAIVLNIPQDKSFCNMSDGYLGGRCSLREYIEKCCKILNCGYSISLNYEDYTLSLNLHKSANRSLTQVTNSPIVLSTDLGDIQSSEYYLNSVNYKNQIIAYTTYQDEIIETIVTYEKYNTVEGIPITQLKSMYYQADIPDTDEDGNLLSKSDVMSLLRQEGKLVLYDQSLVSSYTCKLNVNNPVFKFGDDYFLGDYVSIKDDDLGIQIDSQFSGYTRTFSSNGETFEPSLGFPQVSLTKILKQKGVI